MRQELGKYYLRFSILPKRLSDGTRIFFDYYYEVHLDLPLLDPVYTIKNISVEEYLVDTLKGNIVDGIDCLSSYDNYKSMLNAAKLAKSGLKDAEFD